MGKWNMTNGHVRWKRLKNSLEYGEYLACLILQIHIIKEEFIKVDIDNRKSNLKFLHRYRQQKQWN